MRVEHIEKIQSKVRGKKGERRKMAEEEIFQFEEAFLPKSSTSSSDHLQLLNSKGLTARVDCVTSSAASPLTSSVDRNATSIPATSTVKRPPVRPVSLELGLRNEGAHSGGRSEINASDNANNNNNWVPKEKSLTSNANYNTSPTGAASKITGEFSDNPSPDSSRPS